MIKRPTWVMVIVLALLAGLVYYVRAVPDNFIQQALDAGKTPTTSAAPAGGTLISAADGPLKGVSIVSADGHSVALKKGTTDWTLSVDGQSPVTADSAAAEQAASQALGLLLAVPEIPVPTSGLSAFGLDKPAYIYEVILASDKTASFKIGNATITGDGYYLQKEDGTVAAVNKFTMDALLNMLQQPPYPTTPTPTPAEMTPTPGA